MNEKTHFSFPRIGVLGGGQLGKMLYEAACPWGLPLAMLDKDKSFPAGRINPDFIEGDFTNYDDVMQFGRQFDILTIEIEGVNQQAIEDLEKEGIRVFPKPETLAIIRDKGRQKDFYLQNGIPTASYQHHPDASSILDALDQGGLTIPFVQKACSGGYDGRGVHIVREKKDLEQLLPVRSIVEPKVEIDKELAVIVARNSTGEITTFPTVEMVFHPTANLVEWLACPADISSKIESAAEQLALEVAKAFDIIGLLAVELFLTKEGELLVNEVAPRPHNSGHHTQNSSNVSQFEQHLRAILGWPLVKPRLLSPSLMVNLLGEPDYVGPAHYRGWDKVMAIEGVHLHLYGKAISKPYRKMGHANVLASDIDHAESIAREVQQTLFIGRKDAEL